MQNCPKLIGRSLLGHRLLSAAWSLPADEADVMQGVRLTPQSLMLYCLFMPEIIKIIDGNNLLDFLRVEIIPGSMRRTHFERSGANILVGGNDFSVLHEVEVDARRCSIRFFSE